MCEDTLIQIATGLIENDAARKAAQASLGWSSPAYSVYVLEDSFDIHYVGCTKQALSKRLSQHKHNGSIRIRQWFSEEDVTIRPVFYGLSMIDAEKKELSLYTELKNDGHTLWQLPPTPKYGMVAGVPDEYIRLIENYRSKGLSYAAIADELNKKRIRTRTGIGAWNPNAVRRTRRDHRASLGLLAPTD